MDVLTSSIVTCHETSEDVAKFELQQLGLKVERLSPGLALCSGDRSFDVVSEAARSSRLMFVRHVLPVQFTVALPGKVARIAPVIASQVRLGGHSDLSVHVRIAGGDSGELKRGALALELEEIARSAGSTIRRKDPRVVCSIVVTGGHARGGVAESGAMLSGWPGGEVRYRADDGQISRAEFKILEAIDVFSIPVRAGQRVLDLGASPGGWARVLSGRGLRVTAVDPAPLDERCEVLERISYFGMTSEEFVRSRPEDRFDLIVNDMKMDADRSAEIMTALSGLLEPGGGAVVTLKLHPASSARMLGKVKEALSILSREYKILGVRQLFHNRSEVTAYVLRA